MPGDTYLYYDYPNNSAYPDALLMAERGSEGYAQLKNLLDFRYCIARVIRGPDGSKGPTLESMPLSYLNQIINAGFSQE
jgi:hypothetical protein